MESAKGRVCCRSARVTALPVTVFLRSGRIGWFIGKSDFFCTHCDRLSSFVVSPFAVFYRIYGFSVGRGPFRCCGRIYSFGQRILIFVRCQYWFSSKNLRNLFCNTPWCCDVLQNIFFFVVSLHATWHILMKVFRFYLSSLVSAWKVFCLLLYRCGVLFICPWAYQSLPSDKRTTPHLNRIIFYIFLIIRLYIQYSL